MSWYNQSTMEVWFIMNRLNSLEFYERRYFCMTVSRRKTALLSVLIAFAMMFAAFTVDVNAASEHKQSVQG